MSYRQFLATLALLLVLFSGTPIALGQTTPPGTEQGTKIGTIVRTAISTALPEVTALLDVIWKNRPNNANKVDKDQLKQAIKTAESELKEKIEADFQTSMQPVKTVAKEISVVTKFLEPVVAANLNVTRMQTRIESTTTLTDEQWTEQQKDWNDAKTSLKKVSTVPDSDLDAIREYWLRDKLNKIKGANDSLVSRVELEMNQKNVKKLAAELNKLSAVIGDVTAAAGYELADLQKDIKFLADWAAGAAAGETNELTLEQKAFKKHLDSRYPGQ